MAATLANLRMGVEFGIYRNHRWYYDCVDTEDVAAINTSGFFNGLKELGGQIGDEILVTHWATALPTGGHPAATDTFTRTLFQVVQISAATPGVVDVSNGDARTMTDSD